MKAETRIKMAHGSGGKLSRDLIESLFRPYFSNPLLNPLGDAAYLPGCFEPLAFTTDSFIVSPIFFPGGDIGKLSVIGTVNDLAVSGAQPLFLSCGMILEEGFEMAKLKTVVQSMADMAQHCQVQIVTGDTKVVERGKGDGIFINTAGIGRVIKAYTPQLDSIQTGDQVLLNGPVGDHGAVILSCQAGLGFQSDLKSDCAPLHELIAALLISGHRIKFMRDPTRGGLASCLNELAAKIQREIVLDETQIPIRPETQGICELLGLDPLYMANEGKGVIVCDPASAKALLPIMKGFEIGQAARIIGEISSVEKPRVVIKTRYSGTRILDMPYAEPLPRIC